jgi:apolipoprotein N-acyltransferase
MALGIGTAAFALLIVGWGELRLRARLPSQTITVGLIASDAPANLRPRNPAQIEKTFADYAAQAQVLIRKGARVIVLPEKNAIVSGDTVGAVDRILGGVAARGAIVATGVERWTDRAKLNELRVYGSDGRLQATYEKHHMLPPFESNLLPGTSLSILREPSGTWGLEICKDMDFPALSRQYGREGAGLLLVPAWDFDVDGWLHGRMAILRGVESGFSIARAPKQGILTVTDDRGRVLAERNTNSAEFAALLSPVPVHHDDTLYDRWGDWFEWLNVAAAVGLILSALLPRRVVLDTVHRKQYTHSSP